MAVEDCEEGDLLGLDIASSAWLLQVEHDGHSVFVVAPGNAVVRVGCVGLDGSPGLLRNLRGKDVGHVAAAAQDLQQSWICKALDRRQSPRARVQRIVLNDFNC